MLNRVVLLAILFASAAVAQEQDQTMINRIMNVDRSKAFTAKKQFETGSFSARQFEAGEYAGVKSARVKEYQTRSFLGIRNPWFGGKVYQTKAGRELTKYVLRDKSFPSRTVDTRMAPDAERASADSGLAARVRKFLGRGKLQAELDAVQDAARSSGGALTMDEVREVLNKNR